MSSSSFLHAPRCRTVAVVLLASYSVVLINAFLFLYVCFLSSTASLPARTEIAAGSFLATADARDRASERSKLLRNCLYYLLFLVLYLSRIFSQWRSLFSFSWPGFCFSLCTDFKNHQLPLARIKKIMESDEDVKVRKLVCSPAFRVCSEEWPAFNQFRLSDNNRNRFPGEMISYFFFRRKCGALPTESILGFSILQLQRKGKERKLSKKLGMLPFVNHLHCVAPANHHLPWRASSSKS